MDERSESGTSSSSASCSVSDTKGDGGAFGVGSGGSSGALLFLSVDVLVNSCGNGSSVATKLSESLSESSILEVSSCVVV